MRHIFLVFALFSANVLVAKTDIHSLWGDTKNTTQTDHEKFTPKPSTTTIKNIQKNKTVLTTVSSQRTQLNNKLNKIAKNIKSAEQAYDGLLESMKTLKADMSKNQAKYEEAKAKIDSFESQIDGLDQKIKTLQDKYVKILIDQFSMSLAINQSHKNTENSFVMRETYEVYKKHSNKALQELKSKMYKSQEEKKTVQGYQRKIKNSISKIEKKYQLYKQKKEEQKIMLSKLSKKELDYRKNINNLVNKQNMIKSTLARLNIIKKKEITEARKREAARKAEIKRRAEVRRKARLAKAAQKRAKDAKEAAALAAANAAAAKKEREKIKSFESKRNVKQVGSSYHKDKIYAYRGGKTISPLKDAKIVKSFGTYTDPIYKMKIFNESITLKSPVADAVVRNVLNGRVVFAGENNMLGKVIIVENANKIHTIYAGLSKISPLIKKGTKVKKGAVVGKVKRKLIFEATKNSKYINPVRLISI